MSDGFEGSLNFGPAVAAIEAAALRAVTLAAEHVLTESRKVVPWEEGTLERSGAASAQADADGVTGAVSYNTPYAVTQHERMDLRHDDGRHAKYLEAPLSEAGDTVAAIAAHEMRKALQ